MTIDWRNPISLEAAMMASPALLKRVSPVRRIVGTRGQSLGQQVSAQAGTEAADGSNPTIFMSRLQTAIMVDAEDIRAAHSGTYVNSSLIETIAPSDFTLSCGIERVLETGGVSNEAAYTRLQYYDGAPSVLVKRGTPFIEPNSNIGLCAYAGEKYFVRTEGLVAAAGAIPTGAVASLGGTIERALKSTGASQIAGTGAFTLGGTETAISSGYGFLALTGVQAKPWPAAKILTHSWGVQGDGSGDGDGNIGFLARALATAGIPFSKIYRQSDASVYAWPRSTAAFRYAIDELVNFTVIDLAVNRMTILTQQENQEYHRRIWKRHKAARHAVMQILPGLQTDGTNTTVDPTYTANALALRNYMLAEVAKSASTRLIDYVYDPLPILEDPDRPTFFKSAYFNDGTHINSAGNVALAADLAPILVSNVIPSFAYI